MRSSELGEILGAVIRFSEASVKVRKLRRCAPLERRLDKALASAFRRQGRAFLRRLALTMRKSFDANASALAEALGPDWVPLFDEAAAETIDLFVGPWDTVVRSALEEGGQAAVAQLGAGELDIAFALENPRAVAWLEGHAASRVAGVNEVTRDQLRRIITDGVAEGATYDEMARRITARFAEMAVGRPQEHIDSRAHLIAVTETAEAYEEGNRVVVDGLTAAGLDMEKSWLTAGGNVCEDCAANDDAGWIPVDDAFPDGSDMPPAHPACRCSALYQRAGAEG